MMRQQATIQIASGGAEMTPMILTHPRFGFLPGETRTLDRFVREVRVFVKRGIRKVLRVKFASFVIIFAVDFLILSGCATNSERAIYDGNYYWGKRATLATTVEAKYLTAKDTSLEKSDRSVPVAQLFASYVKPGFTSRQMGLALPDFEWLEHCTLKKCGGLGGFSPVYRGVGEAAFELRLFPDDKGSTAWIITFVLPERPEHLLDEADARAFVTGTLANERVRLLEFSIFHPVPFTSNPNPEVHVIERFTPKGVGIMIL